MTTTTSSTSTSTSTTTTVQYQHFVGSFGIEADNATALVGAFYGPERVAVTALFKKSISDALEGVDPSHVEIIALGTAGARRLDSARRLQASGGLIVEYAIVMDKLLADARNLDADMVNNGIQAGILEKVRDALVNDAPSLGLSAMASTVTVKQLQWVSKPIAYALVGVTELPTTTTTTTTTTTRTRTTTTMTSTTSMTSTMSSTTTTSTTVEWLSPIGMDGDAAPAAAAAGAVAAAFGSCCCCALLCALAVVVYRKCKNRSKSSEPSGVVAVDDTEEGQDPQGAAAEEAQQVVEASPGPIEAAVVEAPVTYETACMSVYSAGEELEVYSKSSAQWVRAVVIGEAVTDDGAQQATVTYTVRALEGGEVLKDVSIDCLRRPFVEGDLVEYAADAAGPWTPAVVAGPRSAAGLDLRPDGGGALLRGVSPSLVRLRFLAGTSVSVYHGPRLPWLGGVVESGEAVVAPDGPPGSALVRVRYDHDEGGSLVPAHTVIATVTQDI